MISRHGRNGSCEISRSNFCGITRHDTPKKAGGVGLASILIACNTQRVKHVMMWLTQRKDIYFSAWQDWAFRSATRSWTAGISPLLERQHLLLQSRRTSGNNLQRLLVPWVSPSLPDPVRRKQQYMAELESLSSTAISGTTLEEWVVELSRPLPSYSRATTTEERIFWPTYSWADNPCGEDIRGI